MRGQKRQLDEEVTGPDSNPIVFLCLCATRITYRRVYLRSRRGVKGFLPTCPGARPGPGFAHVADSKEERPARGPTASGPGLGRPEPAALVAPGSVQRPCCCGKGAEAESGTWGFQTGRPTPFTVSRPLTGSEVRSACCRWSGVTPRRWDFAPGRER